MRKDFDVSLHVKESDDYDIWVGVVKGFSGEPVFKFGYDVRIYFDTIDQARGVLKKMLFDLDSLNKVKVEKES